MIDGLVCGSLWHVHWGGLSSLVGLLEGPVTMSITRRKQMAVLLSGATVGLL
jgi:hypothetical protein